MGMEERKKKQKCVQKRKAPYSVHTKGDTEAGKQKRDSKTRHVYKRASRGGISLGWGVHNSSVAEENTNYCFQGKNHYHVGSLLATMNVFRAPTCPAYIVQFIKHFYLHEGDFRACVGIPHNVTPMECACVCRGAF